MTTTVAPAAPRGRLRTLLLSIGRGIVAGLAMGNATYCTFAPWYPYTTGLRDPEDTPG
jgi:hypothetical protein